MTNNAHYTTKPIAMPFEQALAISGAEVKAKWAGHRFADDYISDRQWSAYYQYRIHRPILMENRDEFLVWLNGKREDDDDRPA